MSQDSIHDACGRGDIDAVRTSIAADARVVDADDEYGWRPVFHAALHRHEPIVRLLIEAGADLSAHDGYVMHYAGEVPGNKAIVSLLIQYGALDAHVRPPDDLARQFLAAVFLDDVKRVQSLINWHRRLPLTPDGRSDYPIHHAARNGDTEVVRALVDGGADVNARGHDGNTVLYCAGGHGHADTVRLLLQAGADPAVKLSEESGTLIEWLAQYPEDTRFKAVADVLNAHST